MCLPPTDEQDEQRQRLQAGMPAVSLLYRPLQQVKLLWPQSGGVAG